jgi:zinc protease
MRDLEEMSVEDARGFFERFYTPRNAVLVLAGDVAPDRGFNLAERYFGDLPAGPAPNGRGPVAAAVETSPKREATMEDRVSLPRVYRAFAVPAYGSEDWVALDVLTYLLSDGESSRLQRRLVRELQIALDVDAYLYPTELEGVLGIVSTARSGAEGARMEAEIERVIREVAEGGVEADEVAGAVRRARRDQLSALANVEERAEELAYATTVLGSPEALEAVLDRYGEVGPEQVQAAARSHLARDVGASVVVVPRPGEVEE